MGKARLCSGLLSLLLLILISLGSVNTEGAVLNVHPRSPDGIRLEPVGSDPDGLVMTAFDSVMVKQTYVLITRIDPNGVTSGYRLPRLRDDLDSGIGVWGISSHGTQSLVDPETYGEYGFMGEVHRTLDSAQVAGVWYINNGLFERRDFFLTRYIRGAWEVTGLCVTPHFLAKYFRSQRSLIFDGSCFSLRYTHGFINARTRLGFLDACPVTGMACTVKDDQRWIFECLNGQHGLNHRSVEDALFFNCGTSLLRAFGGDSLNTELSPTINNNLTIMPNQIDRRTDAVLVFTGALDDLDPFEYIWGTPAVRAYNPRFGSSDHDRIIITLVGREQRTGFAGIVAFDPTHDPVVEGARAEGSLIPLDGDGIGPNRDERWWEVYSNYVDLDPAAVIYGYSVTRQGTDVSVRWQADQEGQALKYLLYHAPSWSGPFVLIGERLAGSGTYDHRVPLGPDGVYRVKEVEADGDTLDQRAEPIGELPAISNGSITLSVEHFARADSLLKKAQEDRAMAVSNERYTIFTVNRFTNPANWLANLWEVTDGLESEVVFVDQPGFPGIQTYVDTHTDITAALLMGDGRDLVSAFGDSVWTNPSMWDTLGFGPRPGWPLQPELDLIRVPFDVDPDSAAVSMPLWTRFYVNLHRLFDRNRNGKPDDGIRYGVAPVSDTTEAWGFCFKTQNARFQPPSYYNERQGYFRGGTNADWNYALSLCDSLEYDIPGWMYNFRTYDTFLAPMSTAQRRTAAYRSYNEGRAWIIDGGVLATPQSLGMAEKDNGFDVAQLQSNPDHLPLVLATCGSTDYTRTEGPLGPPICEPLLNTPDKGPWAIIGPDKGSFGQGWHEFTRRVIRLLYGYIGMPQTRRIGDVVNEGICAVIDSTVYTRHAQSIKLLGDPNVPFRSPGPPVVGVREAQPQYRFQIRPNPAIRQFVAQYELPRDQQIELEVFDLQGRRVATLTDGWQVAGRHAVTWDGHPSLSPGMYLVRMHSADFQAERKVVLMR